VRYFYNPEEGGDAPAAPANDVPAGDGAGAAPAAPEAPAQEQPWFSSLPQDLQQDPSVTKFKSPEDLARSYVGLQKLAGSKDPEKYIQVPGPEDDGTGRRAALTKLGLPDNPDGYELQAPEGAPEGFKPDTDMGKAFKQKAHELGVLPDQAKGLFDWYGQLTGQTVTQQQQQLQEQQQANVDALRKEWGDAFDVRVKTANFAVNTLESKIGAEDGQLLEKLNAAGLGNDPDVIKALYEMGRVYTDSGDGPATGEKGSQKFGTSPQEAKDKGNALLRQAMEIKNPAERRRLNQEAQKWFEMAAR
jgi:hypothetical protein